ncbi:MAG: flavodoxin [Elusimicrobiaceae bacterium]|nr:flavodoxin [Elusimicrobiaceae bacterium]
MEKTLVAYFSASGVTAGVAKRLAKVVQADVFEICPQVPYTKEDLNWTDTASRTSVEMRDPDCRPALAVAVPDLKEYKIILLGFPIWWYREPSIIDSFLESADFKGKTIIPFVTSGGSELGQAPTNMQKLVPQATVKEGRRFEAGTSDQALAEWVAQWL